LAALAIICLAAFLLIRNQPVADPKLFFVLRVVLSLCAAIFGATIPGFLSLGWSGGGLAVRSGGALALFALTFLYTPDLVKDQAPNAGVQINQKSTGSLSPPIVGNTGSIHLESGNEQNNR
jgi:hypothetical protein